MRRRTVLLGTGVTLSATIAGCADAAPGEEDETDDDGAGETSGEENGDDGGDDTGADDGGDDGEADDEEETGEELEEAESPIEGLEILEHELVEDEYSVWVEGVVVNNTGEDLRTVELDVAFYDADGQQVDEAATNSAELADGEEWTFEVMSVADEIADYTVAITDATPVERRAA